MAVTAKVDAKYVSQSRKKQLLRLRFSNVCVPFDLSMKLMQILVRIESAIETMVNMAAFETTTGSLAAVAHSSYLRLLLGAVSGFSLFSATSLQANCCINVIDFPRPATRRRERQPLSMNQSVALSTGKVIRVNETRHLTSLPMRKSALLPA
jgi:broad specificity phosphatase PhoE